MIQRIQSVYLLIAAILFAGTIFSPIVDINFGDTAVSLSGSGINGATIADSHTPWGITLFAGYAALLALVSIFCFKQRIKQIKLTKVLLLSGIVLYITMGGYIAAALSGETDATDTAPSYGAFLPAAAIFFTYLAGRAIRHDEELVRAADRFR